LEVCVEGEAVCFGDFSALGVFDEDFEFCTGERLEVSFQFVGGDGRCVFNVLLSESLAWWGVRERTLKERDSLSSTVLKSMRMTIAYVLTLRSCFRDLKVARMSAFPCS
jgi:hypothetical protein